MVPSSNRGKAEPNLETRGRSEQNQGRSCCLGPRNYELKIQLQSQISDTEHINFHLYSNLSYSVRIWIFLLARSQIKIIDNTDDVDVDVD